MFKKVHWEYTYWIAAVSVAGETCFLAVDLYKVPVAQV